MIDINPNELPIEILEKSPFVQELMSDSNKYKDLMAEIKIPYILKDKVLLSEGIWNDIYYDEKEIATAIKNTDWSKKENRSLFLDHKDSETSEWVGEVLNIKYVPGKGAVGDLVVVDPNTAIKLAYGAKFAISPKVEGDVEGKEIKNFKFLNNSIVINPACKTTWINNSEVKKMEEEEKKKIDTTEETEQPPVEETKQPTKETETKEETKETQENSESELQALKEELLTLINEVREVLKKEKKYPDETDKTDKKKEYPYPEKKSNEELSDKEEEIKKLKQEVQKLNERLNEPAKVIEKTEVKIETPEEKVKKMTDEELDEAFAVKMLKAQGTIIGGD